MKHSSTDPSLYQRPSILRRLAAIHYDGLLLMAVSIAYGLVYIGLNKLLFGAAEDRATGLAFQLGWLLTLLGFFHYFWTRGGQTTGMRAWRLQLISTRGKTPTPGQCLLRFVLAVPGWLFFVTSFFDREQKMLQDKLSGTELILLANKHSSIAQ